MQAAEFINTAVELYGHDRAQEVCATILDSITFANEYYDQPWELETIRLGFQSWPDEIEGLPAYPVMGLSDGYYGFGIMLNSVVTVEKVLSFLPPVIIHEAAHAVQRQYGYVQDDFQWGFFKHVFDEGTADWHSHQFYDSHLSGTHRDLRTYPPIENLQSEIAEIINIGPEFEVATLIKYLIGDKCTPRKGYRVGLQVVECALQMDLISEEELVEVTDEWARDIGREIMAAT